jgi:hypothetical protein
MYKHKQLIFSRKYNLVTEKEVENKLSKYPLDEQINDLQQIECCVNEISLKTEKLGEKIRLYCFKCALTILDDKPTIDGLISKKSNGDMQQCYRKIIQAYIRIIWKQKCDEALKERSNYGMPLTSAIYANTPLPDFPEEKLQ